MALKDFPNNWEAFSNAPDDMFMEHTFEEVMDWKVAGWELPSSVECIVRVTDTDTKMIREHIYKKRGMAKRSVQKYMHTGGYEITICDHASIHHLYPSTEDEYYEETDNE